MRQTSRERWAIVEGEFRPALGEFQASLEGIDLTPELDNLFFLLRKVELSADCKRDQRVWRVPGKISGTHDRVQETTWFRISDAVRLGTLSTTVTREGYDGSMLKVGKRALPELEA